MQNTNTLGTHLLLQALAHPRIRAGELQLIQGGTHVQARTAHQNRVAATAANLLNQLTATLLKLRHGRLIPHIHNVEQVVRNAARLLCSDLRGTDIHAPVELHGVSVNALTIQAQSQLNRERALTGAGRAHNSDNGQSFGDSHAPHSTGSLTPPTCGEDEGPKNRAHDSNLGFRGAGRWSACPDPPAHRAPGWCRYRRNQPGSGPTRHRRGCGAAGTAQRSGQKSGGRNQPR